MARYLIAEEGPLKGLIVDLEAGAEWLLGKDPDLCDYILEDESVSDKHAKLEKSKEGISLTNFSSDNPCLVNGAPLTESYLLKDGDHITIGQTKFLFVHQAKKEEETTKEESYDTIFDEPLIDSSEEPSKETKEEETPPFEKTVYDTIFEESSEYEELPFHLLGEFPLILKVVSGPNAGAEIGLQKDKTYIIGKDPNECDVIFQDVSVSRKHSKLTISSKGELTLEDLESKNKTLVNNHPIDTPTKITGQDLVQLGTTTFLIIDKEAVAETIYAPSAERPEEEEEVPLEEIHEKIPWKERIVPFRHLIIGGGILLILFIVFLSFFSLFKSETAQVAEKAETEQVEEVVTKYPDIRFTYNPASGKLFITGHVITAMDKEELMYHINQLPFITDVEDHIVIDEYVAKITNDVLAENEGFKGINVAVPEAGKFVVTGYLQTEKDAEKLGDYLNLDFPYLDRLRNEAVVEADVHEQISSMLTQKGFSAISFKITNGDLVLTGRYNAKKVRFYDDLMAKMRKIQGVRSVRNFAIPSSAAAASIDLSQKYNVTGYAMADGTNYSVVINGKIYLLGQTMDEMKITDIEKDTILLEKDGINYKINYSR